MNTPADPLIVATAQLVRVQLLAGWVDQALESFHDVAAASHPGGLKAHLPFLTAEAERIAATGDHREAIQRWQDIAALLGEDTPEWLYHKLSDAYAQNAAGFGGSSEENRVWGDCHKHTVLAWLHRWLQPSLYLEIGVDSGASLACAPGPAIGVDPRPALQLSQPLPRRARIVAYSSDDFFKSKAASTLQPAPELIFIDGMHLFEFALRDFIHCERYAAPWSLIVIDDIYPCHPVQAQRRRASASWTGDVWKLHSILQDLRPDLTLMALNTKTTGLLLIAGLNPASTTLSIAYKEIVAQRRHNCAPPEAVLARAGAMPSDHPFVPALLTLLRQARHEGSGSAELQSALQSLKPGLASIGRQAVRPDPSCQRRCQLLEPPPAFFNEPPKAVLA